MLKNRKTIFLLFAMISFIIIGSISQSRADEKPKVTMLLKDLDTQYWQILKAGAEKGFKDFGIQGKIVATKAESYYEQGRSLEEEYESNPDALILAPYDSTIVPVLEQLHEKNEIPVVLVDQNVAWDSKAAFIGTDNRELGQKAGSLLASELQPGNKVAFIGGGMETPVFKERISGARSSLEDAGMIIAAESLGIYDDEKTVKKEMTKVVTKHPDIKGVIATHDLVAIQAIEALEEIGVSIPVIGADGITDMLELIEEGKISGTVAQNPYDMGYLSVEMAAKAIKGETVEEFVDTGVDIIIKENVRQRLVFLNKRLK
ncbi:sugar ABC transporter substrate-binding protein [Mesobacillus foraminis]|uniref:sugar ABC transporter substrate-binding protein n=1 Tax=Mesobacillus foraminis TaxID=279826 RepID=UPI0039A15AB7